MNYTDNFQALWTEVKNYLELQKRYIKLDTAEKLTVFFSAVATATVCLTLVAMALFFLLFALATLIGQAMEELWLGYLIMGAFLLLLMMVVYLKRKQWIIQPLSRLIVGLFINEEEEEEEEEEP
jgi:energy-coupling factor transporter transmembrane protein EcfT